ncbi:MAG: glycosyltransferase [Nitrospira sp.]|nr:glycosyltransferase [Nitrospira sp.]
MIKVLFVCPHWEKQHSPDGIPVCIKQQATALNGTGKVRAQIKTVQTGSNPMNYLLAWARFHLQSQILTAHDLVHCHWGYLPLVVFPSAKPVIVTLHGGDVYEHRNNRRLIKYRERLVGIVTKYCARRALRVIAVSKHLGTQLGGIPFKVIPNGVDPSLFYPMDQQLARRTLGLPSHKKIVLFGAAPENRVKNFALAQIVCCLSRERPMLLTLNGVPHEKVATYMNASDALLLTSYREGSPDVVKEALACGLPVLSVDVGDVAERTHSLSGCKVVQSYDPKVLSEELDIMFSSRKRISASIADLDQTNTTANLLSIYNEALSIQSSGVEGH